VGKLSIGYAPYIRWNAARGTQEKMKLHSDLDWWQRFVPHRQGGTLRGKQAAETKYDRKRPNCLPWIHHAPFVFSSFDFTLATA
ncbi:MAG: hypothetical protein WCB56_03310, partial [Terriglobales bacterium]